MVLSVCSMEPVFRDVEAKDQLCSTLSNTSDKSLFNASRF